MVVTFGALLVDDAYTITVADTVVSASAGVPIDGDGDGEAGGDAVFTMEHRCRADVNDNGSIDFPDILAILANRGPCGR